MATYTGSQVNPYLRGKGLGPAIDSYNLRVSDQASQDFADQMRKSEDLKRAGLVGEVAGLFTGIAGGLQNYNNISFKRNMAKLQGEQFIINAEEASNNIREQFLETTATASAMTAARGVSRSSGTPRTLMEFSAEQSGRDIDQIQRTAKKKKMAKDYEARQLGIAKKSALWNLGFQTSAKAGGIALKAFSGGLI